MANFTTDGKLCIERQIEVARQEQDSDLLTRFDIHETCVWIKEKNLKKVSIYYFKISYYVILIYIMY